MDRNRKRRPFVAFLILQLIIYLSINNVHAINSLNFLENVPYSFYPAMNTNFYQGDGELCFSLNPSKISQESGAIISQATSADINLIKAFYYGYNGPGNLMGNLTTSQQKTYTHLLASYVYSKDMKGFTFYTLNSYFNCNLIDYYNQLPYLADPNHYEMAFTNNQMTFTNDGIRQVSNSVGLVATDGTGGYFDLPADLTLVNETKQTATTGQRCYIHAEDVFHFEAPGDYLSEIMDLDFNLNQNVFTYQVWLGKVLGTVDLANPANDSYSTVARLIKTPANITGTINLAFQFKPQLTIRALTDLGNAAAGQKIRITGPGSYDSIVETDQAGQIDLVNLSPGNYYVSSPESSFPYKDNEETYSVTLEYGAKQNMTLYFDEVTQAVAVYRLNSQDPPLESEMFDIAGDYHTKGFSDFSLNDYEPQEIAIVKSGQKLLQSSQAEDVEGGVVVGLDNFPEYLTYENGSYYLTIDLYGNLKSIATPIFYGRNGIIDANQVSESNLRDMIFEATRINCIYQEQDETAELTIGDLEINRFTKPGITVVEFIYQSSSGLQFETSYNVVVVDSKASGSTGQVRFIDQANLTRLDCGYYADNQVARDFLEDSLIKTEPLLSFELDDAKLKQIKTDFLENPDFDLYHHDAIAQGKVLDCPAIETASLSAIIDEFKNVTVFENGIAIANEDLYLNLTKSIYGAVECLVSRKDDYLGSLSYKFTQTKIDLSMATANVIMAQTFDGLPQYPRPDLYFQNNKLLFGKDYQLSYDNNVSIGTAAIKVTGINKYYGEFTLNFQIKGE